MFNWISKKYVSAILSIFSITDVHADTCRSNPSRYHVEDKINCHTRSLTLTIYTRIAFDFNLSRKATLCLVVLLTRKRKNTWNGKSYFPLQYKWLSEASSLAKTIFFSTFFLFLSLFTNSVNYLNNAWVRNKLDKLFQNLSENFATNIKEEEKDKDILHSRDLKDM